MRGRLKEKSKKAFDRYLILELANSIEPVEHWLKSYRQSILHIERAWIDIHLKHEAAITSLLDHLNKNNGRLIEKIVTSVGGTARKQEHFEQHKIITYVSSPEAIPLLKQVSQRVNLVEAFVHAVKTVRTEPNDQMFSNLAAFN